MIAARPIATSFRRVRLAIALVAALLTALVFAPSAPAVYLHTGTFSGPGTGDGQLESPGRAAVEQATGNLFVVDSGNDRVQVFAPNGSGGADYLTQLGGGELSEPWGIAIDEDAGQTYVYVADAGNDRIVKYDSDEAATPGFSVSGSFSSPAKGAGSGEVGDFRAALAIDPTSHQLLLADAGNDLIQRLEANGAFVSAFDGSNGGSAFAGPIDVAVNSSGDVYVIDANGDIANAEGTSKALRYSGSGEFQAELGPVGSHERVATVAVDRADDSALVSGDQDAVYEAGPPPFLPALQRFDSANAPLSTPGVQETALYDRVSGLAFASAGPRFYVVLDYGINFGSPFGSVEIQAFLDIPPVDVVTGPTTGLTDTTATLTGSVDPTGAPPITSCEFEYGADTSYGTSVPCEPAGSIAEATDVSASVSGLSPNTEYHYRLTATNANGPNSGADRTFTTLGPPTIESSGARDVTSRAGALIATIDPGGISTTYRFEYGLTTAYGTSVPAPEASAGAGDAGTDVSIPIGGLEPATEYHARVVATNAYGVTVGPDIAFRTFRTPRPFRLAGNRVYEMVTPPDKSGSDLQTNSTSVTAAADGNSVVYQNKSSYGDAHGTGNSGVVWYVASRGSTSWPNHSIVPYVDPNNSQSAGGIAYPAFSDDLSVALVENAFPIPGVPIPANQDIRLIYRETIGPPDIFQSLVPPSTTVPEFGIHNSFRSGSSDLSHLALQTNVNLVPPASGTTQKVYHWTPSAITLASILPNGNPAPSAVMTRDGATSQPFYVRNMMSVDGDRIAFLAPASTATAQVYLRVDNTRTAHVSQSEREVPDPAAPAKFEEMTPDGEIVFFRSAARLTDDDPDAVGEPVTDLYRYVDGPEPGSEENLELISTGAAHQKVEGVIGASDDGTRVYFIAGQQIYLWIDGEIRHVAANDDSELLSINVQIRPRQSRVTSDGRYLLFKAPGPGPSGAHQLHLYDAAADSLVCASCDPRGLAGQSVSIFAVGHGILLNSKYLPRALAEDGRVFFNADGPLVPEDTNGVADAYEYDPGSGEVSLLSTGRDDDPSYFIDASRSGDDVFIVTRERLVGWDRDGILDLYDARVGGGQPEPPAAKPVCVGDSCLPPPVLPADVVPASSAFSGPGNARPRNARRLKKAKQRQRRRQAKEKRRKQKQAQRRARTK